VPGIPCAPAAHRDPSGQCGTSFSCPFLFLVRAFDFVAQHATKRVEEDEMKRTALLALFMVLVMPVVGTAQGQPGGQAGTGRVTGIVVDPRVWSSRLSQ
jgi:hypothetical protein